jgi:hypothetical protein
MPPLFPFAHSSREPSQVLRGRHEEEFVFGAAWASQPQAPDPKDALEMRLPRRSWSGCGDGASADWRVIASSTLEAPAIIAGLDDIAVVSGEL